LVRQIDESLSWLGSGAKFYTDRQRKEVIDLFRQERAVEPFDLPIGLGPVGAGLLELDPELLCALSEHTGAVGRAVVCEHPFHPDPQRCEVAMHALQEARGRSLPLICQRFQVGEA